jgi:glucosyl-dolichyl phosphate glucuronosyltransferase
VATHSRPRVQADRTGPASLSVSVIIPTKDRPGDLEATIESLLRQTRPPDEIIVVDQSAARSFTKPIPIPLRYIHDPKIGGLTEAKNAGMKASQGDIWVFLDDDVILEPRFLEELLAAYSPDVAGVSGIITNYTKPRLGRLLWDTIFMRGPFRDVRQRIYWKAASLKDAKPIPVRQFGGGLMSFRASSIQGLRFDANSKGASPGEDLDFCAQIPRDRILVMAPKARLVHNKTPQARASVHWLSLHAQVYYYLRERHWRFGLWNKICFAWLKAGYASAALLSCLKRRSPDSWIAWREGARKGFELARPGNSHRNDAPADSHTTRGLSGSARSH